RNDHAQSVALRHPPSWPSQGVTTRPISLPPPSPPNAKHSRRLRRAPSQPNYAQVACRRGSQSNRAQKGTHIRGQDTTRRSLPVCRAPAVDSFRCAHVSPCVRDNRLTRWTRFSSSTEQFAEEGLVFGVRILHVGAPPALTSTPCPVPSGARSNSPRPSAPRHSVHPLPRIPSVLSRCIDLHRLVDHS
ncbi:hypothetical protein B0H14DRAFT_3904261, partial [Mycena olivaceomarginata]